ncbi:MAG TPA: GNAT family N-acetyltransferase [Thermoanaerobaculia bacterium]|nr:GNAT family N-acetyltransferase [Thermoanaerobaculia bacterium]
MIRDAREDDAAQVAALLGELGYPTTEAQVRARIAALTARDDYTVRVFADADTILGVISLQVHPGLEIDEPIGLITALVVGTKARRRGVARALVEDVLDFARKHGCARVNVGSGLHRADAHAFYEDIGFTRSGIRFRKTLT